MDNTMHTKNADKRIPSPTKRALGVYVEPSNTDVNGSYTGKPKNKNEKFWISMTFAVSPYNYW